MKKLSSEPHYFWHHQLLLEQFDDYLSRHPQLKESATVDIYVKRMAFMMALMDAPTTI
ncbi:hypothetical protein [Klebsiella pneumoniae]|uniref:hypothetical protein n=1 Tax=Klebsiella pneumoniae TaxID=573 RepID=UPI00129D0C09|nr:hypothetical protein [Klebsiella pneumoniae]